MYTTPFGSFSGLRLTYTRGLPALTMALVIGPVAVVSTGRMATASIPGAREVFHLAHLLGGVIGRINNGSAHETEI
jgi:hypothetical protein